ncbi:hypothetical protein D3C71_1694080 [compost metagenome]
MALRAKRQQPGATAVGTGVELDPQLPQRVETETEGAVGESGLDARSESLGPFFGFGLRRVVLTEVAVDVVVAHINAGLAVADEVGHGAGGDHGQTQCGGQRKQ